MYQPSSQMEASADAECIFDGEKERLSHSLCHDQERRLSTPLLRAWHSMSNTGSPRNTIQLLDINYVQFSLDPKQIRSGCCSWCFRMILLIVVVIMVFALGWFSRAEYDQIIADEADTLPVPERTPRKSPGTGERPQLGSEADSVVAPKNLEGFKKILNHKKVSNKKWAAAFFTKLSKNQALVEETAANLLEHLKPGSKHLTKAQAKLLLDAVAYKAGAVAGYSANTVWFALGSVTDTLWGGMEPYTKTPKKCIKLLDLQILVRNLFRFSMGDKPFTNDAKPNENLSHYFYSLDKIDYELMEAPKGWTMKSFIAEQKKAGKPLPWVATA